MAAPHGSCSELSGVQTQATEHNLQVISKSHTARSSHLHCALLLTQRVASLKTWGVQLASPLAGRGRLPGPAVASLAEGTGAGALERALAGACAADREACIAQQT